MQNGNKRLGSERNVGGGVVGLDLALAIAVGGGGGVRLDVDGQAPALALGQALAVGGGVGGICGHEWACNLDLLHGAAGSADSVFAGSGGDRIRLLRPFDVWQLRQRLPRLIFFTLRSQQHTSHIETCEPRRQALNMFKLVFSGSRVSSACKRDKFDRRRTPQILNPMHADPPLLTEQSIMSVMSIPAGTQSAWDSFTVP